MANSKITWVDKESLVTDPTIAEKNKVTDSNMNEIKNVVNENADQLIVSDTEPTSNDNEIWLDTSDTIPYVNSEVNIGATNPNNTPTWFKQSKNLFNKNNVINGYYIDASGNLVATADNYAGNDFIKIDNTKAYYVSGGQTQVIRICYYTSSQTFISRELIANAGALTIPNNAKYVKISSYTTNLNTLQLEQNSTATTYEAYVRKAININGNDEYYTNDYLTEEQVIGTWLGKPLYRKVVDFGALPNNTEKQVTTGLASSVIIVKVYGISNYTQNNATYTPIPYVDPADLTKSMNIIVRDYGTKVGIKTAMDYSGFSAKVVLEYTKTTD